MNIIKLIQKVKEYKKISDIYDEANNYEPLSYPLIALLSEKKIGKYKQKAARRDIEWFEDAGKTVNQLQIFYTKFENINDYKKYAIKHLKEINKTLWFGEINKVENNINIDSEGVRKMGGIIQSLKKNKRIIKLKKNFNRKEFDKFLMDGYVYGSDSKILFIDKETYKYLLDKILYLSKVYDSIFGSKVYDSVFGKVNIIVEPSFEKSMMCLIDIENVNYYYLNNRDTFLTIHLEQLEYQDLDISQDEREKMIKKLPSLHCYVTECTVQFTRPDNHLMALIQKMSKN